MPTGCDVEVLTGCDVEVPTGFDDGIMGGRDVDWPIVPDVETTVGFVVKLLIVIFSKKMNTQYYVSESMFSSTARRMPKAYARCETVHKT